MPAPIRTPRTKIITVITVLLSTRNAVVVRDGFSYVYTVGADQKVSQLKVQIGRQSADRVEVISGLKADARVVASGGAFLNHGDTVRVVEATSASQPASQ